ncbi:hypothetical protein HKCCE4037_17905 [Rhodobacterales bacterium HKCCE4037]|nr:hypothetical protein [Rhodobacterales bacterium HKCCE4037]
MFTKFALPALALAAALTAGPLAAQTVEVVTGIGFGNSQTEAFTNSVRAWLIEAIELYGQGANDFGSALTTDVQCFEQQGNGFTTLGIETIGNPSAPWSCTVRGIPAAAIGG